MQAVWLQIPGLLNLSVLPLFCVAFGEGKSHFANWKALRKMWCYFYLTRALYSGDYGLLGMCLLQAKPVHILPLFLTRRCPHRFGHLKKKILTLMYPQE